MKSAPLKVIVVVLGAITFSTLGIFAADTIRGIDGNLAQLVGSKSQSDCPSGMTLLSGGDFRICVDIYEASPSSNCPHPILNNTIESERNVTASGCTAASVKGSVPWAYVSLSQAQRACASAGKRLPLPSEWYRLALGAETKTCVTDKSAAGKTGESECIASSGTYDAVGNMWEWVDAQVTNNEYKGRVLPESGFVTGVDTDGVAISTEGASSELYGDDYFWSKTEGVFGIIRGGFYGSGSDAGLYTLNASVPTNFAAQGVGFRCVKDVV